MFFQHFAGGVILFVQDIGLFQRSGGVVDRFQHEFELGIALHAEMVFGVDDSFLRSIGGESRCFIAFFDLESVKPDGRIIIPSP